MYPYNFAAFYRHFITRAQIHICDTIYLPCGASSFSSNVDIRGYTSTRGSPSSIRRSSHPDLLGFSAAIRRRFEKKQTVEGGSTFAMYRLGIMAVGAFRALFQPLEGSSFVSPRAEERYTSLSYPIPSLGSSSSPTSRRICELNLNGSPPFRSFQRVPMFSLRLMYSRKARPFFAPSSSRHLFLLLPV